MGRAQTFLLADLSLDPMPVPGDRVVVQTEAGPAVGSVVPAIPGVAERHRLGADTPNKVVRKATAEDVVIRLKRQQREQEAHRLALLKIRERGLEMKLTRVEQLFDGSRMIFYFTAEGRVDFRELVRELAAEFHTRIEMRQIGARDEAKMLGGYGSCGRPLCCTTWLKTFEPVSIKMAKQQDLSLNPSRLSGLCGRLKCCLRYELPNAKGVRGGGCGDEGGCNNPTGCGTGGGCGTCGSEGCGSCSLIGRSSSMSPPHCHYGRRPRRHRALKSRRKPRPTLGSVLPANRSFTARIAASNRACSPPKRDRRPTRRSSARSAMRRSVSWQASPPRRSTRRRWSLAGLPWRGHTDMLAALTHSSEVAMMFHADKLRVVLATIHIPLSEVPSALTIESVRTIIRLTAREMPRFKIPRARIALAGLNPHAGEQGVIGHEEETVLIPAVQLGSGGGHRRHRPVAG